MNYREAFEGKRALSALIGVYARKKDTAHVVEAAKVVNKLDAALGVYEIAKSALMDEYGEAQGENVSIPLGKREKYTKALTEASEVNASIKFEKVSVSGELLPEFPPDLIPGLLYVAELA